MVGTLTGAQPHFDGGLIEVASGVYGWLQPNGDWGETNAGLIVGDGESLLVDTLWDLNLAGQMLAAMEPVVTPAPIRTVVNTHSDGDHWWGNGTVPAQARIITSVAALAAMQAEAAPAAMGRMAGLTRIAARLPGRIGQLGSYVSGMLAPFDFSSIRPRLPDQTFTGTKTVTVGGREVRLIQVGPAHTAGDVVLHVPDAGVVFGGDILFFGSTPVSWHGPISGWLSALDLLLSLDADRYVPGHGPVADAAKVIAVRDYWTWLSLATAEQYATGRDPLPAAQRLIRAAEFSRWRDWLGPERLMINVTTLYRGLSGAGPISTSPLSRAKLFSQVATVARDIETG